MTELISFNIRAPKDLAQRIRELAKTSGLTANDFIVSALQAHLGFEAPSDPTNELLQLLSSWISENYSKRDFPNNIILIASKEIAKNPQWRALYDAAVEGEDGKPDAGLKKLMAQKIGRCVKRAVQGETFARSVMQTGEDDLIGTFSLLRPTQSEETAPQETAPKKDRKKSLSE